MNPDEAEKPSMKPSEKLKLSFHQINGQNVAELWTILDALSARLDTVEKMNKLMLEMINTQREICKNYLTISNLKLIEPEPAKKCEHDQGKFWIKLGEYVEWANKEFNEECIFCSKSTEPQPLCVNPKHLHVVIKDGVCPACAKPPSSRLAEVLKRAYKDSAEAETEACADMARAVLAEVEKMIDECIGTNSNYSIQIKKKLRELL